MRRGYETAASVLLAAVLLLAAPGAPATAAPRTPAGASRAWPTEPSAGHPRTPENCGGSRRASAESCETDGRGSSSPNPDPRAGNHDWGDHRRDHGGRNGEDDDHDKDDRRVPPGGGSEGGPCADTTGPVGALTKQVMVDGHTYSSDPGGLSVTPGDVVSVTISWSPSTLREAPAQIVDCLFVGHPPAMGGRDLGPAFAQTDTPPTVEPFTTSFTVLGKWEGRTICDRGKASGGPGDGEGGAVVSNQFCFFVEPPAVVPEVPWPALFVVVPMLAVALVVARRRRSAHAAT